MLHLSYDRLMPFEFDQAVAVTPLGNGLYSSPVQDGWDINGNANGGYLLALAASAMRAESGRNHPISITMHYLSPAPAGDAQMHCEVLKSGRRLATVEGTLQQNGRNIVRSIGVFGDLDATAGPQLVTAEMPEIPPYAECQPRSLPDQKPLGLGTRIDMRLHPDDNGFSRGEVNGVGRVRGWFAFQDGRPVDTLGLLLAADSFPPVIFNALGMLGWVPTIELTVHVRGVPALGPIACEFRCSVVQGGYWEESGTLWDSTGRCVAMTRQISLVPQGTN